MASNVSPLVEAAVSGDVDRRESTANNVSPLEEAALSGDVDRLYALIQENPNILRDVDTKDFVDTPLHIAASVDIWTNPSLEIKYFCFAAEIMALKPSFALKLSPQGLSPLHLAIQHGHRSLAGYFVDMNKDLVRVKGREGTTPLHLVSQIGECDLIVRFLLACPDSIQYLNSRNETALHVAVRCGQFDALVVLVGWLRRNTSMDARFLESSILNGRDVANNTILHLSVMNQDIEALDFLIKHRGLYLDAKNSEKKTALDLAGGREDIKSKLSRAGARPGSSVGDNPPNMKFRRPISESEEMKIRAGRLRGNMSDSQHDAYLVATALILTVIYQSALSPPGGLYQADASNLNATSSINSAAGKSVLSDNNFIFLLIINTTSLAFTTMTFIFLIPPGDIRDLLIIPTWYFVASYVYSVSLLRPPERETTHSSPGPVGFIFSVVVFLMFIPVIFLYISRKRRYIHLAA
ncbi:hypothetical protein PIB30_016056 [Stylosanthes scabra]|uniref:PGG domain-containing protein n=1 Tax=Stylosanthes scabra TaxID=79078 RepID=A0ABU6Z656_9FABA|nr:hypothetical protein [Stylosanthes scabra]